MVSQDSKAWTKPAAGGVMTLSDLTEEACLRPRL